MAAPMSTSMDFKEQLVSYKTYRDTYRNTYQISRYVSLVKKVYRYTPSLQLAIALTFPVTHRNDDELTNSVNTSIFATQVNSPVSRIVERSLVESQIDKIKYIIPLSMILFILGSLNTYYMYIFTSQAQLPQYSLKIKKGANFLRDFFIDLLKIMFFFIVFSVGTQAKQNVDVEINRWNQQCTGDGIQTNIMSGL